MRSIWKELKFIFLLVGIFIFLASYLLQDTQTGKAGNGFSTSIDGHNKNSATDLNANLPLRPLKGNTESRNSINTADQATWSKFDRSGFIQKDGPTARSSQGPTKRKGSNLGSKSKRLRMENEDSMELKVTWEEAQELLRPPPNHVPTIVVIEGIEIEEYEVCQFRILIPIFLLVSCRCA